MRDIYAMCVEWTKPSGVENRSLSIRLLHVAGTVRLRLCIKFVRDDRTLENECPCHSKLLQELRFHHHFRCRLEALCGRNDDPVVRIVDVSKHTRSKMRSIRTVHENVLDCLMTSFTVASKTIRARNVPEVQISI